MGANGYYRPIAVVANRKRIEGLDRLRRTYLTDLKALSLKTILLFVATAIAEIVGCYLPYLWLSKGATAWLLVPAAVSLALFAWLLTLHPAAAGRVYAAYGGVYITVALAWLWGVDGVRPRVWDFAGVAISLIGMALIAFQPRAA